MRRKQAGVRAASGMPPSLSTKLTDRIIHMLQSTGGVLGIKGCSDRIHSVFDGWSGVTGQWFASTVCYAWLVLLISPISGIFIAAGACDFS